jgi:hypothetical protein
MKTMTRFSAVFAVLMSAHLWTGNAMPPVPHRISGSIQGMDAERRELVVTNANRCVMLTWTTAALDGTCLKAGDNITVYYRKEIGRLVIRGFDSAGLCNVCN